MNNQQFATKIDQIATLAKLSLSPKEKKDIVKQLPEIITFVEQINQARTKSTQPLFSVTGKKNVFREDKIEPSIPVKEALTNARSVYKNYFKVDAILEEK